MTKIEAPKPITATGAPCPGCGNIYLHKIDCPQLTRQPQERA